MHESLRAVILGLVEGLTEFLPVSSTGHLILFGEVLDFRGSFAESFEVIIQLGAILAVVALYLPRFLGLLSFNSNAFARGLSGVAGWMKLILTTLPAALVGVLFKDQIKAHLFNPTSVALALFVGGVVMVFIERLTAQRAVEEIQTISSKQALFIGLFQCFALWPGISRSASSIIGGMTLGLNRQAAAEFSFLAAVPLIAGASLMEFLDLFKVIEWGQISILAIGFIVSFVAALIAIKLFVTLLNQLGLKPFGWYRIVLALFVLTLTYV